MRVKVETVGPGLHPDEAVIAVKTRDGYENLAVDRESLHDEAINIGWPVGQENDYLLVELPRETFRGIWRVWVPRENVIRDSKEAKAVA